MDNGINIDKVEKNSRRIWAIICVLGAFIVAFYKFSVEIYNFKDLPATVKNKAEQKDVDALTLRIKTLEKDNDKLKSIPDKFVVLEGRTSALELQLATSVAEIKTLLLEVRNNQNILNEQVIKAGLEHKR